MPKKKAKTEQVEKQSKLLVRDISIEDRSIDEKARTVEISFSSEEPVRRWGEDEVLDHSPESVRLDRAKTNGPLLMDHRWNDQIGIIEKIFIDADRVGRAVVRFGKSERASEIFQDVVDGIRKSISVGYRIYKVIHEEMNSDEVDVYRVVDWEPLEISFVSVPADITVGVGRSQESETENTYTLIREVPKMDEDQIENENQPAVRNAGMTAEERQAAIDKAIKGDRKRDSDRRRSIERIAATYTGHDEIVREAMNSDTSVDDFVERIAAAELKSRESDVPDTHLDMDAKDVQRFSVVKAIRAAESGNWKDAGLEEEASRAVEEKLGREARGVFIPHDIQSRVITTTGSGVGAVGTDHLPGSFIDLLRDSSLVMRLGARQLSGLKGNLEIPRKTGSASFALVDEDEDSPNSEMTVGTLALSPKTMSGSTPISRKALLQSSPDMDMLVMQDLAEGAALFMDLLALIGGQSVSTNTSIDGILSTTGVLTQAIVAAGSPTWPEVVGFETAVTAANALNGQNFITTAPVRGNMKTIKKDAGSGIFLIEDNKANGYDVYAKTDSGFPANTMLFGDFSQVIMAMWGVLDLVPDTSTKAASGGLVVRAFQDLDVGVRQPTAFCKNA